MGPSTVKLGGYALIGGGALAVVFGVATMMYEAPQETAQGQQPGQVPAAPPASSAAPNPPAQAPEQPQAGGQQPGPQQPNRPPEAVRPPQEGQAGNPVPGNQPSPNPRPGAPDGAGRDDSRIVVRVYNNSTIKNLAHRAAGDFRKVGYDVPEVGNYSAGRIYATTVYFRPGTVEEAQANEVATHFGARVEPRFEGLEQASSGVIVIVTNDYKGEPTPK